MIVFKAFDFVPCRLEVLHQRQASAFAGFVQGLVSKFGQYCIYWSACCGNQTLRFYASQPLMQVLGIP